MIDLTSKKVLITGGSRGIGAECVRLFAKANAEVAFTFNKGKQQAEQLVKEISSLSGVHAYKINILDHNSIEETVNNVLTDLGRIDILVNNAGVWKYAKSEEMTLEQWKETIDLNLTGTFLFTKAVISVMKKNLFGRIINITSTAGQRGEPFYSHYAASKGGVISYTKSLAVELGKFNITVNSVAPGWVITDMTTDVFSNPDYKEKVRSEIPTGRIAAPEDIAGPVLFLASDLARQINGEILNVNGGSVLCG